MHFTPATVLILKDVGWDVKPYTLSAKKFAVPRIKAFEKTPAQAPSSKRTMPTVRGSARVGGLLSLRFFLGDPFAEQRMNELLGIKRLQIVHLLAQSHEFDGNVQLLPDRNYDAAFRRTVQLR